MKYYKNGTQITAQQIKAELTAEELEELNNYYEIEDDGIRYEVEEDSNIAGLVVGRIYDDTMSEYPYLKFVEQCNKLYKFRVVEFDEIGNAVDTDLTINLTYREASDLI